MTHVHDLVTWVKAKRAVLEQYGEVTLSRGPQGTDNPAAHLLIVLSPDEDVELLVWESGDAEFNHGSFADPVFEHVELDSPEEFAALLERVLGTVTGST